MCFGAGATNACPAAARRPDVPDLPCDAAHRRRCLVVRSALGTHSPRRPISGARQLTGGRVSGSLRRLLRIDRCSRCGAVVALPEDDRTWVHAPLIDDSHIASPSRAEPATSTEASNSAVEASVSLGPPACPHGHGPMIRRTNRMRGTHFWSCGAFPRCRETAAFRPGDRPPEKPLRRPVGPAAWPSDRDWSPEYVPATDPEDPEQIYVDEVYGPDWSDAMENMGWDLRRD
jgi:hypothetical protein